MPFFHEQDPKYMDYYERALYNQVLGSKLTWAEKGVTVTQSTDFPREQGSTITIGGGSASFELKLRVPSWAAGGFKVTVNGSVVGGTPVAGRYFTVSRRDLGRGAVQRQRPRWSRVCGPPWTRG